jgi:hypothetical protein
MKATLAILVAAVVAVASGCATSSSPDQAARIAADASKRPTLDKACVQDTGSRIKPSKEEDATKAKANCMQPGSTYSREELDQTGEIDMGRALRQLDPRIQ